MSIIERSGITTPQAVYTTPVTPKISPEEIKKTEMGEVPKPPVNNVSNWEKAGEIGKKLLQFPADNELIKAGLSNVVSAFKDFSKNSIDALKGAGNYVGDKTKNALDFIGKGLKGEAADEVKISEEQKAEWNKTIDSDCENIFKTYKEGMEAVESGDRQAISNMNLAFFAAKMKLNRSVLNAQKQGWKPEGDIQKKIEQTFELNIGDIAPKETEKPATQPDVGGVVGGIAKGISKMFR